MTRVGGLVIICLVAAHTVLRRALVNLRRMTLGAGHRGVRTQQRPQVFVGRTLQTIDGVSGLAIG